MSATSTRSSHGRNSKLGEQINMIIMYVRKARGKSSTVAMQEFVFLRYVLDSQMNFGVVGGEAIVLREREFPIFRNHVL